MRNYKALVRNKDTKEIKIVELVSDNVDMASKELNLAGYQIVNERIYRSEKFDAICATEGKDWHWHSNRPIYKNNPVFKQMQQMPLMLPAPTGKKVKCAYCGTESYKGYTCPKCQSEVKTKYQLRKGKVA